MNGRPMMEIRRNEVRWSGIQNVPNVMNNVDILFIVLLPRQTEKEAQTTDLSTKILPPNAMLVLIAILGHLYAIRALEALLKQRKWICQR
jgi:hypothetical protein